MPAATSSASRYDRRVMRLAELDAIRGVLVRAADTVREGWVQHDWSTPGGVCLVTSVRAHSTGQVRARCLDVVWHARYGDAQLLGRVPTPAVRTARVRDLTRWNDHSDRRPVDVLALLAAAEQLAASEMGRLRAESHLSRVVSRRPRRGVEAARVQVR